MSNDTVTPTEALAVLDETLQNVWKHSQAMVWGGSEQAWFSDETLAAAIIAALPEGWHLANSAQSASTQEVERQAVYAGILLDQLEAQAISWEDGTGLVVPLDVIRAALEARTPR
jgi:hypothetical protein